MNSCRTGNYEKEAKVFLNQHRVKYHEFNNNNPELILKYKTDTRKISADIYVDDKCLAGLPYKSIKDDFKEKFDEQIFPMGLVDKIVDWKKIYEMIKSKSNK